MTLTFQRLLDMLRGRRPSTPAAKGASRSATQGYALASTGETVYDDRPLRFRSLTLTEVDEPLADDPSGAPGFKIRISKLRRGRKEASTLVEHKYTDRGYELPVLGKDPNLYTFMAYDEGQLVGTVSVRMDGKRGLSADDLYPEELKSLRAQDFRLCEFTRLAVDKRAASKPVLAGLFHTAYLYAAVIRGATHAVIEVNPRHVRFYGRALRFRTIGEARINRRVNAPAVLLYVPFADIADGLARYAGRLDEISAGGSVFPFCFPPAEEVGVLARLRDLVRAS
jgi:hypothetical protein